VRARTIQIVDVHFDYAMPLENARELVERESEAAVERSVHAAGAGCDKLHTV
jgi:hypothetical protein